jgi:4'-phosphopantetheinyl transferase EntD
VVNAQLYPEELSYVARAVPKRQAEFGVARICARRAMAELGIAPCPLVPYPDRSPRWPEGIVGSITHAAGYCAVVVSRSSRARGLGLDAESDSPLEPNVEARISTVSELRWLGTRPAAERAWLGKLLFCAKEAFYKCQYPTTREFLEFREVELFIDVPGSTFSVQRIARTGETWRSVAAMRGRFLRAGGLILTGAAM